MASISAKQLVLAAPIEGVPQPEHFRVDHAECPANPTGPGEVVFKALVFSADPFQRGRLRDVKPGEVISGFVAGKILASTNEKWAAGDLLGAMLPYKTTQIVTEESFSKSMVWKLNDYLKDESEISYGVGVLGMPGSTAYGGLIDILRPNKGKGETLFVSAASGAVGGLVGQLAKNVFGCTVIGSAGGPEKGRVLTERFGFDAHVDYKAHPDTETLTAALKEKAPDGIDMYYENVGGSHFEAAMANLRPHGRVAVCGIISTYNDAVRTPSPLNLGQMIYTFQRIEGFVCWPWLTGQKGSFLKDMSGWLRDGTVKVEETFWDGIDKWPEAFQALFTGKNLGKVVVRVGSD
eukprot:TRINITY_DN10491_c3_g1_i1.p1 TRINITY_DN10491_c3_g1~~TRINITY_DN10491_c3_g1_i1.p1  ORF type:complete len:349 (-),score=75.89 TRINITY_DN10491_c3_g1_i1:102-1148(-)